MNKMENYGRITYDQYVGTGIRPATFYYENERLELARRKVGQLVIGVSPLNSSYHKPLPLMMLNPMWYNWRGDPLENNFYICTVRGNQYLCFHANGVIFIIDDNHYDINSIKPMGNIGELEYNMQYA